MESFATNSARAASARLTSFFFAVMAVYRGAFERALYSRGTSREELVDRLVDRLASRS